jgi:hypothetical protein
MKEKRNNYWIKMVLIGLCAVVITFGLTSGSVLAAEASQEDHEKLQDLKKKEAEKKLPPRMSGRTKVTPTSARRRPIRFPIWFSFSC